MPTCAVPGCTSGYASNHEKVHCFTIPKNPDREAIWKRAIKRLDSAVRAGRTVCEKHFLKSDIVWQRQLLSPDGHVLGVSHYKVPRLKKGAVPSIFSWTEGTEVIDTKESIGTLQLQNVIGKNEENPSEAILRVWHNKTLDMGDEGKKCGFADVPDSGISQKHDPLVLYNQKNDIPAALEDHERVKKLMENQAREHKISSGIDSPSTSRSSITFLELIRAQIPVPQDWTLQTFERTNLLLVSLMECKHVNGIFKPVCVKAIIVKEDMSVEIVVLGMQVNLCKLNISRSISEVSQLQDLLATINGLNVCNGCAGLSAMTVMTETEKLSCKTLTKDVAEQWRHKTCSLLLSSKTVCDLCQTAKKTLSRRFHRWKTGEVKELKDTFPNSPRQKKQWLQFRSKYRAIIRSRNRAKSTVKNLKTDLRKCYEKVASCTDLNLEEQFEKGKISKNQLEVLKQIVNAAKHENCKKRNYSEDWLLLCTRIHMRSPSGYDFLRRNEVLPLPCVRTIQRYLSKIDSNYEFDRKFFEALQLALSKKDESQTHGILLLDEISSRERVSGNNKNLTYKGLIDFGQEGQQPSDFSENANHGLVLMFQPLNDTYTQPVAVFASRDPAKGDALTKLIIKAIILLENAGAKIHAVVSDGASPNRKFWAEVGVDGSKNNLRTYFDHPSVEGRKVFVFSDTSYLLKTIRNRFHNAKVLQMDPSEPTIEWKYLEMLYEKNQEFAGPGRNLVCHKLTANHVYLNNSLKMRVRLATQIFSNSVADGLRYFEKYVPELKGCEATASFCKWLNDMFDALNRKNPEYGVQPDNADFQIIQQSVEKLNAWEEQAQTGKLSEDLFLTKPTAEGLRVTLQSSLDITRYLTENYNFKYILTGRINRDPLEAFY